ncbi:MAG TPA: hypothetical protein VM802_28430 [Chitinophaga sp.]|uniref:dioxygenase family protein n=1 Tax=Chitinophaga sp. TaxID=1869181 RepID=UPI002BCE6706|nr:hypothetical protein [Chitinophaga sp.]HVI48830.1 hypothetical protein [Chitinophaga sp.]
MKRIYTFPIVCLTAALLICSCNAARSGSQESTVAASKADTAKDIAIGDYCDGCDAMYEGMPANDSIRTVVTIADTHEPGERLTVTGKVYQPDGKTPAPHITLYIWHTNAQGYYEPSPGQINGKLHGHLRNWAQTDNDGNFTINSIRPAPYPDRDVPAHIHILVKEPHKTLYYIDEVWFDDDPLVTPSLRAQAEKRGGDLIIHLSKGEAGSWNGRVNIILGRNIPNYK